MASREVLVARASALVLLCVAACREDRAQGERSPPRPPDRACASCGGEGEPSCALERTELEPCLIELASHDGGTDLSISVAWSPSDDLVLFGENGELRVLALEGEPPSFRELSVFRNQGGRIAVAWSPDGRFALSASSDLRLLSVDRATGALTELAPPFTENSGDIYALAWAPSGAAALIVGEDGVARLLGVDTLGGTLDELASFAVDDGKTYDVAFSPNGELAGIANESGSLVILRVDVDARTLTEVTRTRGDGWVTAVAWSPRGDQILSGTWLPCNSVLLSSIGADGTELVPKSAFHRHASGVGVLEFDPLGDLALTAGHDDTISLFDVSGPERTLEHLATWNDNAHGVHDVTFSPDGTRVIVAASHIDRLTLLDIAACTP